MFKQLKLMAVLAIAATLVACGTPSPEIEACIKSTPRASSARWNCVDKSYAATEERETIERITRQCEALGVKRETEKFLTCAIEMRKSEALSKKKPTFAEALGEGMINNATRKPAFTQCFHNGPYTNCITR